MLFRRCRGRVLFSIAGDGLLLGGFGGFLLVAFRVAARFVLGGQRIVAIGVILQRRPARRRYPWAAC